METQAEFLRGREKYIFKSVDDAVTFVYWVKNKVSNYWLDQILAQKLYFLVWSHYTANHTMPEADSELNYQELPIKLSPYDFVTSPIGPLSIRIGQVFGKDKYCRYYEQRAKSFNPDDFFYNKSRKVVLDYLLQLLVKGVEGSQFALVRNDLAWEFTRKSWSDPQFGQLVPYRDLIYELLSPKCHFKRSSPQVNKRAGMSLELASENKIALQYALRHSELEGMQVLYNYKHHGEKDWLERLQALEEKEKLP